MQRHHYGLSCELLVLLLHEMVRRGIEEEVARRLGDDNRENEEGEAGSELHRVLLVVPVVDLLPRLGGDPILLHGGKLPVGDRSHVPHRHLAQMASAKQCTSQHFDLILTENSSVLLVKTKVS